MLPQIKLRCPLRNQVLTTLGTPQINQGFQLTTLYPIAFCGCPSNCQFSKAFLFSISVRLQSSLRVVKVILSVSASQFSVTFLIKASLPHEGYQMVLQNSYLNFMTVLTEASLSQIVIRHRLEGGKATECPRLPFRMGRPITLASREDTDGYFFRDLSVGIKCFQPSVSALFSFFRFQNRYTLYAHSLIENKPFLCSKQ